MERLYLTAIGAAGTDPLRIAMRLNPPINVSGDVEIAVLSYKFTGALGGAPSLHSLSADIAGTSIAGSGFNQTIALVHTIGAIPTSGIQWARVENPLRFIPLNANGLIQRIVINVQVISGETPLTPITSGNESVVELVMRRYRENE